PITGSGMSWMRDSVWFLGALAAAVVVIPLQYFRRATVHARGIALGAVLLAAVSTYVPWTPAFSFQQWFSADPAAAEAVVVAFDPNLGKLAVEPGLGHRANSVW